MGRRKNPNNSRWSRVLDWLCCGCLWRQNDEDDDDNGDVFVTRTFASASAENIVKHHDIQMQARCQSVLSVAAYVDLKIKEKPKKRKWYKSMFQNRHETKEENMDRWAEVFAGIGVEVEADIGMFADGTELREIEPSNHFVDEGGELWDADLIIW